MPADDVECIGAPNGPCWAPLLEEGWMDVLNKVAASHPDFIKVFVKLQDTHCSTDRRVKR